MELAALEARIQALNQEKKTATFNKVIGESSPEELERIARQLRAERKKAVEVASRAELHTTFAQHPNPKVRECLKTISSWGKDELCALDNFKVDIANKRKVVGVLGFRKQEPYEPSDPMPYTRAELESHLEDSETRAVSLLTTVMELFHELQIPAADLKPVVKHAGFVATQVADSKKRKLTHARRGCECLPEHCGVAGTKGEKCKCATGGIACDQRCMCHSSGKCVNPKNLAENTEDKEEREDLVEGRLHMRETEIYEITQLAARAAVAAAMDVDVSRR